MEAQYYQPKIEEFHVGFEYEIIVTHIHNGEKQDNLYLKNFMTIDTDLKQISSQIENKIIRVKCIDNQDIIDLGWHDNLMHDKDGFLFCIEQIENKVLITQIGTAALKQDIALYFGNIKNKSELKRIMQMLKIIE